MRLGGVLALVVVGGYVGFELHAIGRNKYRTERDFVYQQFVGARQAQMMCGGAQERKERFERNLVSVKQRAAELVKSRQPDLTDTQLAAEMAQLESSALTPVKDLIDSKGCKDIEAFKLIKRYENLARLNLP